MVQHPNYTNAQENLDRRTVLSAYRGYPNSLLFQGFPRDVKWFRVRLEPMDFESMRYANFSIARDLSRGTLLVKEGAKTVVHVPNLPNGSEHIPGVVTELRRGHAFPPLLVVEGPGVPLTLLEGHSRATAYMIENKTVDVQAYVARSPSMHSWAFR